MKTPCDSLPFDMASLPRGFFGEGKARVLYPLAMTASSILEIGSWIGRSTCVICHALAARPDRVPFVTTDFFVETEAEWFDRWGIELRSKKTAGRYLAVMARPGGARQVLEDNLTARGFRHLVEVRKGDFREMDFGRRFGLIFCDATHDRREIDLNMPRVAELIEPGGVLVCDDIRDDGMRAIVLRYGTWRKHRRIGKLLLARAA